MKMLDSYHIYEILKIFYLFLIIVELVMINSKLKSK